jgi:hypothetical protein
MAQEEPVSTPPKEPVAEKPLRVRRGRVDSVDLYEIKDNELDLLERGSPVGLYLNFAIFLLSIAFSALAGLCTTTTFKYAIAQTVFIVVMVIGFLLGALLLILWFRGRKDVAEVIGRIRGRIPPESSLTSSDGAAPGIPPGEAPR